MSLQDAVVQLRINIGRLEAMWSKKKIKVTRLAASEFFVHSSSTAQGTGLGGQSSRFFSL